MPCFTYFSALYHWSPNIGIATKGTPAVIASSVDCNPVCVMNNFIFGCPVINEKIFELQQI